MTQVPATRSATTNVTKYQLDKCKATRTQNKTRSLSILHPAKKAANYATPRNLLLIFIHIDPAITISSLLLPCNFARPAIAAATNGNFSLQVIVKSFSTEAEQAASATISDKAFKLIVVYFKISLHFCKDGGIFCEREWEQQRRLNGHTRIVAITISSATAVFSAVAIAFAAAIIIAAAIALTSSVAITEASTDFTAAGVVIVFIIAVANVVVINVASACQKLFSLEGVDLKVDFRCKSILDLLK